MSRRPSLNEALYRRGRRRFREACRAGRARCHICKQPVDYSLPAGHPQSWSLDHLVPVAKSPHRELDRSNWASSHLSYNKARGARALDTAWVRPAW